MEKGSGSMGFSIGEVSQAVGLAPQTLRLWERERLIRPRRTDRGYRVYTEPDVQRLREIKQLRKVTLFPYTTLFRSDRKSVV